MLSLVEDCAAGDVGEGSGHGTSPIRGHKGGYLAQLVQRRQPSQYGLLPHPGDDLLARHAPRNPRSASNSSRKSVDRSLSPLASMCVPAGAICVSSPLWIDVLCAAG